MFRGIFVAAIGIAIMAPLLSAQSQKADSDQDKNFDVRSSVGDMHVGPDADARKAGLPLYPGARPHRDKENGDSFNLGVFTEAFGVKLVIAKYDSGDEPGKIISYYRDR